MELHHKVMHPELPYSPVVAEIFGPETVEPGAAEAASLQREETTARTEAHREEAEALPEVQKDGP